MIFGFASSSGEIPYTLTPQSRYWETLLSQSLQLGRFPYSDLNLPHSSLCSRQDAFQYQEQREGMSSMMKTVLKMPSRIVLFNGGTEMLYKSCRVGSRGVSAQM